MREVSSFWEGTWQLIMGLRGNAVKLLPRKFHIFEAIEKLFLCTMQNQALFYVLQYSVINFKEISCQNINFFVKIFFGV